MHSLTDPTTVIHKLKKQCSNPSRTSIFSQECLELQGQILENRGFIGAIKTLSLIGEQAIIHNSPACIAAQTVYMSSRNVISLGMDSAAPVILYAPDTLSISTKHLFIENLQILGTPECAVVFCETLTVSNNQDAEIIRRWSNNKNMQVFIQDPALTRCN